MRVYVSRRSPFGTVARVVCPLPFFFNIQSSYYIIVDRVQLSYGLGLGSGEEINWIDRVLIK
jgi:hypothetical protein